MDALSFLEGELEQLGREGLLRSPVDARARLDVQEAARARGVEFVDVSSNDYLGYAREGVSRETLAACLSEPPGAGASRLLHGTSPVQDQLEHHLAAWVHLPTALLFSSGYAANTGTLSSLPGPGDLIVSDALNHASIIDGCRLSRATVHVIPHLDLNAARHALSTIPARRRWFVTESYFSMDGDTPNLPALRRLCNETAAALIVDEAHALGVFGPAGAGLCAQNAIRPDILIGTLGKALGAQGAFVAATLPARTWLWNRARPFVYSTGFSPLLARLVLANLHRARRDGAARARLAAVAAALATTLRAASLSLPANPSGPILPVFLHDNARALRAAAALATQGILAQAIRPPTVPPGTARLRVTLTANLSHTQLHHLTRNLIAACTD